MLPTATSLSTCGFCGTEMLDTDLECSACGKSRVRATPVAGWNAFTPGSHFAALWFFSVGLYILLWYYRAWKFLRVEIGEDVRPLWRTLLMCVPLLGQVLMFQLVKDLSWVTTRSDGGAFGTVMFVWGAFAVGKLADRLEGFWSIPFYLVAGAGIWVVQRRINEYYRTRGSITHAPMPVYGWIVCGFGALLWLALALETAGFISEE